MLSNLFSKNKHRVKTPTVLQMEAVECGAAALAIILHYHELFIPLEQLRIACGVSRDGSKASNVLKAARSFGMKASGMRAEISILRTYDFPVIIFWEFNHFLVVEGMSDDWVWLNDPGTGPRRVSMESFSSSYTGVTLQVKPGPEFKRGGKLNSAVNSLKTRLQGSKSALVFVTLASFGLVFPGLVIPVFTQVFIDSILIEQLNGWVKPLLLGMVITAILRMGFTWLQKNYMLRMEMRLALATSASFFWYVLRLPVEFFTQRQAGDISQRVESNDQVAHLLAGELAINIVALITSVLYVALMLTYSVWLTLLGVTLTAVNIFALGFVNRQRTDGNLQLQQESSKVMSATMGGIQTIETIKATGGEADFFNRWAGLSAKVNNTKQKLEASSKMLETLPVLMTALTTVAILGLGGLLVMQGEMTIGMLVAFQSLMASFAAPIGGLLGLASKFQAAKSDLTRLDDVLRYPLAERFNTNEVVANASSGSPASVGSAYTEPRKLQGFLELNDVSFGYSRLEPALIESFCLKLAPGQRVALVGSSGSGKSTVAKIVMGLAKPWTGTVAIDGVPTHDIPAESLHSTIAGVDQEIYLFEGTVRDNLTMWDKTIPEISMVRAAQDALIHDVIVSRSKGYDSSVGEGGRNFSGGQAQRLELARALATNPRILVMDEATSALDPISEKYILDQLRKRGCTCLVVAHRLSSIRDCDEIIVMEMGKVVERGTHETLMITAGAYSKLVGTMTS